MSKVFQLTVLGTRGSMAACRSDSRLFGGDTSCYMVQAGEETIFLDAGSGLASAPAQYPKPPAILLTHLHLDHVIGLGMFPGFTVPGRRARLYVPFCRDSAEAAEQMARVFSPPFWPLTLGDLEGKPELLPLPREFQIGELQVEAIEGNHPNKAMILKLRFDGRCLVYATDYEHEERSFARLIDFAKDADLLLYDAQFTEQQYQNCRGFGHSTAQKGLELMRRSGAKRLLLIHHAPASTDEILLQRERELQAENASYAREGEILSL